MNLFPQSKEWVLNELIDPTTNTVTPHLNFINKSLTRECEVFINYSYRDLVDGFNNFLRCPNIDDDEYDDEYDECLICYNEIKSIVKFGILLFKSGYYFKLEMSCFDVCALLLICKKLTEENMITVENPEDFIELILSELDNPIFSLLEDELYNPTLFEGEIDYSYIADFISYYDVLNNDLMTDYYFLHDYDNHISLNLILNGGNYSYLFLNDEYKKLTYEGIYLDALNHLDDCIINNIDFKNDLFKYNPEALSYRNEWSSDRALVLEAVKNDGGALEYASQDLKSDREVVLAAVKNFGSVLQYASEDLKSDRVVVLEAVKNDGMALEYASEALRSEREVVLVAVKQTAEYDVNDSYLRSAFKYCSKELGNDIEFIIESNKIDIKTIGLVDSDLISKHSELQKLYKQYCIVLK